MLCARHRARIRPDGRRHGYRYEHQDPSLRKPHSIDSLEEMIAWLPTRDLKEKGILSAPK